MKQPSRPVRLFCGILALVLWQASVRNSCGDDASRPPNIVLILADDLGWSDLGCYGADLIETPNLDRFSHEGLRFTDAYAMSVCTPSRATLMTGKHAARLHMTIWSEGTGSGPTNRKMLQGESRHDLPHTETTLAKHLHDAGYLTAHVGKWHLGGAEYYPETHGFDVNIGGTFWGAPESFFWPYRGSGTFGRTLRYVPHTEWGRPGEYLTDRLTDEALDVINRAGDRPFFLYLAHHGVHTPIQAKTADIERFKTKPRDGLRHQHPVFAAMVKSLDDSVGRVLDHLQKRKLEENTIVIFASDNGGFIGSDNVNGQSVPIDNNAPLRSGKGSLYEGGVRVPLIVRWPGVTPQGKVCSEPVVLTDLFATCIHAAGLTPVEEAADGLDLAPLFKEPTAKLDRGALYFHYPHYYATTTPAGAIRARNWKLIEYFEDERVELYNLAKDLSEKTNLAQKMPKKANQLRKRLHNWRTSVNAAMPTPNPDFQAKAN